MCIRDRAGTNVDTRVLGGTIRITEHRAVQLVADPRRRGLEQLLARLKMLVRRAAVDAGELRHLEDAEALFAVLREDLARGFQDRFARALGISLPALPFLRGVSLGPGWGIVGLSQVLTLLWPFYVNP